MSRGFLLVPGFLLRAGWVLAVAIFLCASVARAQQPLIVFSAASLKGAFDERAAVFERGGGAPVKVSYGGSLTLARQIDQGAPADVFCAADAQSMAWAQSRQLIDPASQFILLRNALVVIAPAGAALAGLELNPEAFRRALGDGRLAMGDPASVPAGKYAKAALESLGVWSAVQGRVAASDNVRAAMLFVSRGEAPLGLVYATDARAEPRVKVVASIPEETHAPIVYPCARVRLSPRASVAQAFLESLKSDASRAAFEAEGFRLGAK